MGPVSDGGKSVEITDHGEVRARIVPVPKLDRKAAWKALKEIGPVPIKLRE
jgi:antitoxin (DNA-binding transcriptional repressor) of toxin-antitoxin stability system